MTDLYVPEFVSQNHPSIIKLMEEWKQKHRSEGKEYFISDGIVDIDLFGKNGCKLCFLLEECYLSERERKNLPDGREKPWDKYIQRRDGEVTYDLAANLCYEQPWYMWYKVKAIAQTIFDAAGMKSCDALKRIAVCNIKKSEGRSSSDLEDIETYASSDCGLIRRELELIDADIIVCGRVFDIARKNSLIDITDGDKIDVEFTPKSGFRAAYRCGKQLVLDMWHPSARISYSRIKGEKEILAGIIRER